MNADLDIGSKNDKLIFDDILMASFLGAWMCDCQTYISLVSNILFDGMCVQVNKMPTLWKAARKGDVKASVAVIRVTGHMQAKHSYIHPHHHAHTHSLTHTHSHTYTYTYTHVFIHTHSLTHSLSPQQVRSLLASGIKPDAERDNREVSVFWCSLD